MPQLWCPPFYFLILCLGLYYHSRVERVFQDVRDRRGLETFWKEMCTPELRRDIRQGLQSTLFGDMPLFSWLMMLSMLRQGGAGCLFWYTLCYVLWLYPLGGLAALWEYYRAPGEKQLDLAAMLERIRRRKGVSPWPRTARWLRRLQMVFLASLLPCIGAALQGARPFPVMETVMGAAAAGWVVCRLAGERLRRWVSTAFLVFLALALAWNLANLIPALLLTVRDAFQLRCVLFALTGAGLEAAVRSGVQLGTGTFLLQGAAAREPEPPFPHPAYAAIYAQMRGKCQLGVQLLVGLLFLCGEIAPQDNRLIERVMYGFFCLFGLEFVANNLRGLFRLGTRRTALACLGIVAALLIADGLWRSLCLSGFTWGVLWLMAVSTAGVLFMDSSWYFALLEQYRDVYLWHAPPHPNISSHMRFH